MGETNDERQLNLYERPMMSIKGSLLITNSTHIKLVKWIMGGLFYGAFMYWLYSKNQADLLIVLFTISLMIPIIFLIRDRFKQQQIIDNLHQESLTAELNLLKSQINPHFFFNTLNNLYGLAVDKSDLTQEVIYKLSQMMRFTIYDGRKDSVSVTDEINYLNNFIELNQIRHRNAVDITFTQNIENDQQRIPPLLFINLLENAFKHGVDTQTANHFIYFTLSTSKTALSFELSNNFDEAVLANNKAKRGVGGVGIESLKRRLALLYPNKHQFTINADNNIYHTKVMIDLT